MNTADIRALLDNFVPTGDDAADTTRLYELTDALKKNDDAFLVSDALFAIFEKYPNAGLGSPGPIVHTLESFSDKISYEAFLLRSLDRKPTYMTLWMLNRLINGEKEEQTKEKYIRKMKEYAEHPNADDFAKREALEYYKYQTEE